MATKLEKPLKREIRIGGKPFVLTIAPGGFKLVGKGRRKGLEISWDDLVGGDAALATALRASLSATLEPSARSLAANDGTPRARRRPGGASHGKRQGRQRPARRGAH